MQYYNLRGSLPQTLIRSEKKMARENSKELFKKTKKFYKKLTVFISWTVVLKTTENVCTSVRNNSVNIA